MIKRKKKYITPSLPPKTLVPDLKPVMTEKQKQHLDASRLQLVDDFKEVNDRYAYISQQRKFIRKRYDAGEIRQEDAVNGLQGLLSLQKDTKDREQYLKGQEEAFNLFERDMVYNVSINESLIDAARKSNQQKIKNYYEEINLLNRGSFNTDKLPDETEDEYFRRLYNNAQEEEYDDLVMKATQENNKLFKELLKELIRDDSKIESITNVLDNEIKHNILKKKPLFKEKFLKLYGENNKKLSIDNILEFCNAFNKSMSGDNAILDYLTNSTSQVGTTEKVIDNTYILSNSGKNVFIKIIDTRYRDPELIYSFTGEPGTFNPFYTKKTKIEGNEEIEELSRDVIAGHLNITMEKLRNYIGGVQSKAIITKLMSIQGLVPETRIEPRDPVSYPPSKTIVQMYGQGITNEEIPDEVSFGNLKLKLNKLFYKNFFSLVDKNGINIPSFKQVKVSDSFVKLIMNMIKNKFPSKSELENLNQNEQNLFDRIIHLAKLHKNPQLEKNVNKTIEDELKRELSLIEADINAGNNNKELVRDMEKLLMALVDYGCINYKNAKKHISQYI